MNLKEEEKYIKDFISNLTDEEFVEMLNECGHNIKIKEDKEEKYEDYINELFEIATELDARNIGANSVIERFHGVGWTELCEKGIELLWKIK